MALSSQLSTLSNPNARPGKGLVSSRELNQLSRKINNIHSSNETLLSVTTSSNGIKITPKLSNLDTPFKGSILTDPNTGLLDKIAIGAGRSLNEPVYKFTDVIVFGLDTVTKTDTEEILLFEEGDVAESTSVFYYVYYEFTDSNGVILTPLQKSIVYPQQSETNIRHILGRATVTAPAAGTGDTFIAQWVQYQIGNIYYPSRLL